MSFFKDVAEVILKSQEAEAVAHSEGKAPSGSASKTISNAANKGTHPKSGGDISNRGSDPEGGEDFQDGSEDTIGSEGKATPARPGTIKHEGGAKKSKLSDLLKGKGEDEDSEEDKKEDVKEDSSGEGDDHEANEEDDASKSMEPIFLDVELFQEEMTQKAVAKAVEILEDRLSKALAPFIEESINKSKDTEFIEESLVKSVDILAEEISDIKKSIESIASFVSTRKSALTLDETNMAKSRLDSTSDLSKGEISKRLLNKAMNGEIGNDIVLKFDAMGDISGIPESVRKSIGLN